MRTLQPIGTTRTEIERSSSSNVVERFTLVVVAHAVIAWSAIAVTERWKVTQREVLLSPDAVTDAELLAGNVVRWEEFQPAVEALQHQGDRALTLRVLRLLLPSMWD